MLFTSKRTIRVSIFILLIIGLVSHMLASRAATGSFADHSSTSVNPQNLPALSDLPHRKVIGDKQKQQVSETLANLPLRFEQNVGQTNDQSQFFTRNQAYNIGFAARHATISLTSLSDKDDKAQAKTASVQMNFIGSNPATRLSGMEKLETRSNYFTGNNPKNWHTNVANFASLKYENLYNGVDAIVYGNEQNVEYDFVVAPQADAQVIQLSFDGAKNVRIDEWGDLILETAAGQMRQHKPIAYQQINGERKVISCDYKLIQTSFNQSAKSSLRNQQLVVGFTLGEYNRNLSLIIDPMIDFSSFLGGGDGLSFDATDVALDANENIYIVGHTYLLPIIASRGIQTQEMSNQRRIFIAKIDSVNKQLVYFTYLTDAPGSFSLLYSSGIAVDEAGSAYITGYINSPTFPTTQGAFQTSLQQQSGFITKLSPDGNTLVYSTFLGAINNSNPALPLPCNSPQSSNCFTRALDIAIDAAGNAYVTGETNVKEFPATPNAFQPAKSNDACGITSTVPGFCSEAFVTKLNAAGTGLIYSTFLGGNGNDSGADIKVDASGNAYIVGTTAAKDFPTQNAINPNFLGGTNDVFLSKLNATGSALLYSTYLGGKDSDTGKALDVDMEGNVYLCGDTYSTDLPTTAGVFQSNPGTSIIYKTTDSGATWKPIVKGFPSILFITEIAIDPNNSSNLLAGTPKGIYQSTDGGESWQATSDEDMDLSTFLTFAPQNPSVAFASTYNPDKGYALLKTTNKGRTWNQITDSIMDRNLGQIFNLQVDPIDLSTLYMSHSNFPSGGVFSSKISKTTDGGATWKNSNEGFSLQANPRLLGINPKDPALLFAIGDRLYRSKNSGEKWKSTDLTDANISVIGFNPANPDVIYVAKNKLYGSTDNGMRWTQINNNLTEFNKLLVTANSLYAISSGKVFRSIDGGKTWADIGSPSGLANAWTLAVDPKNPAIIYAGAGRNEQDSFVMKLTSQGSAISYCTYLGGSKSDSISSIAVDNLGNASVTGRTESTDFPTRDAIQPKSFIYSAAFVTKLNVTGATVYSTYMGGLAIGTAIATDKSGRVYVAGTINSAQFPQILPVQAFAGIPSSFITRLTDAPLSHPAPQVFSITPDSGIALGQTRVTIKGANFLQGATVGIGGLFSIPRLMTEDTVITDANTIQTTVRGNYGGPADIIVMNPDGQLGFLSQAFDLLFTPYIAEVRPGNGQFQIIGFSFGNIGYGFDSGAVLLINGKEIKVDPPITTEIIMSKKAFKKIKSGQTVQLQVRNGNGSLSNIYTYRRQF